MRVRKKKNGDVRRAACGPLLLPFDKNDIKPLDMASLFPETVKSYRLEIGCGKGAFITAMAEKNPDVGFLAVEKASDVVLLAAEKTAKAELTNLRFLNCDAEYLPRLLPEGAFERLYLNFCDPWPKARHAKRRLTYRASLLRMAPFLAESGRIEFKTDNSGLFEFSLPEFEAAGFAVENVTRDLHASEWAAENIMTEYERNFSAKGFKINRLEAFLAKKPEKNEKIFEGIEKKA